MEVRRIKSNELYHHGVKGQRWGVRRYQNEDGTLTDAGRKRLLKDFNRTEKKHNGIADKKFTDKYGLNETNTDIQEANAQYAKERGIMHDASKLTPEEWDNESKRFDNLIKKAKIKYAADELHYSLAQMYCLNRGIDPVKYSKKVKQAEENYRKNMEKAVNKIIGDVGNTPLKDSNHWAKTVGVKIADMKIREKLVGDYFLSMDLDNGTGQYAYDEDKEIFSKLIKAAKNN